MSFFKKRKKEILYITFSIILIAQSIGLSYGRSHRLVRNELDQLHDIWQKASIIELITPEKLVNHTELVSAKARLKVAEREIQNSQKNVEAGGEEIVQKAHIYYHELTLTYLAIVDFLLAKEGNYSANGSHLFFSNDVDAEKFAKLVNQLNQLNQNFKQVIL